MREKLKNIDFRNKIKLNNKVKIIFICVLFTVIVYIGGIIFFQTHTYPKTTLLDEEFGNIVNEKIEENANNIIVEKEITLNDGENDPVILNYSELGLELNLERINDIITEQQQLFWPIEIFTNHPISAENVLLINNETQHDVFLSTGIIDGNKRNKPSNAKVIFQEEQFEIEKEVSGNIIDEESMTSDLAQSLYIGNSEFDLTNYYSTPTITSEDLVDTKELMNATLQKDVVVYFGEESYKFTVQDKSNWIDYNKSGELEIDEAAITETLSSMDDNYLTVSNDSTKRVVTSYDASNLASEISSDLTTEAQQLSYSATVNENVQDLNQKAKTSDDTYIEVNIESQHLWYYLNGELFMDAPVVTGTANGTMDTPIGEYTIWQKSEDRVLDGSTVGYDYLVPVEYFMSVDYTGVGIHDTDWHSPDEYGSDLYLTDGSHGCIGMPLDKMKLLYDNTEIGTPIYITA